MDSKHRQLNLLKDNLENFELFIKEIEDTLYIIENTDDPDIKEQCRIKMAQIQQYIASISSTVEQPLTHQRKLTS